MFLVDEIADFIDYADGHSYKQVVKGNDDSRQDAVMQQVSSVATIILMIIIFYL